MPHLKSSISTSMRQFIYEPLDLVQPSSRLVLLIRGNEGPIECELVHAHVHDADNSIDYGALSYTWVCAIKDYDVTVNGGCLAITENLYQAVRYLRDQEEDRILCIDAICINQDDSREQGHQVQQMASVYECARQVVIWLGEPANGTDAMYDSIQVLQRQALNHACNDWSPSDDRWRFLWATTTMSKTQNQHLLRQTTECLKTLLWREWFQRIWVLQEVAKARAAKIVCGTKSASARIFALIPRSLGIALNLTHNQSSTSCLNHLGVTLGGPSNETCTLCYVNLLKARLLTTDISYTRRREYPLMSLRAARCYLTTAIPDRGNTEHCCLLIGLPNHDLVISRLPP
jgi:hypothetical protein